MGYIIHQAAGSLVGATLVVALSGSCPFWWVALSGYFLFPTPYFLLPTPYSLPHRRGQTKRMSSIHNSMPTPTPMQIAASVAVSGMVPNSPCRKGR